MTELVINDHEKEREHIPVVAGQIRAGEDSLVLIAKSIIYKKFTAIYLKGREDDLKFCLTHSDLISADVIMFNFPHVIENARITVDLNE